MVSLLVMLLILAIVVYVACLIIDQVAPVHPVNLILKLIVGVFALLFVLQKTGLLHGAGL